MTIREDMLNGFGTCHGGVLYTFADTALSCACNSRNERSVAHHCSMIYLRPGKLGERLTASAVERSRPGRVGLYDVKVTDSSGAVDRRVPRPRAPDRRVRVLAGRNPTTSKPEQTN